MLRPVPPRVSSSSTADFDLHGLVGVRVVDGTADDRAAVAAQLGLIAGSLDREPDIVIRFVDRLHAGRPLRTLGAGDAAFGDDAFIVMRSKHRSAVRVQIPFEAVGGRCEIVCERGLPAVPLLLAIINLTVLAKGGLALHASAFRYQDLDVLVTGWSKGGKTELLLAYLQEGAEYIGDEWIYFSGEGTRIFGIPEPIRVWDWHLSQLPHYRRELSLRRRALLLALRHARALLSRLSAFERSRHQLRRMADLVDRQRYAFLPPARAFGSRMGSLAGSADRIIYIGNSEAEETRLETVSSTWIAERMVFSLEEERSTLGTYYRMFRFAFPERRNALIEMASQLESTRLHALLARCPCYALHHPYPPSIRQLFVATAPTIVAGDDSNSTFAEGLP